VSFAAPVPLWLAVLIAAAIGAAAFLSYRRPLVPLSPAQRFTLVVLRAATLATVIILLCRPVLILPSRALDASIPVLVDTSRSMRVTDGGDRSRLVRSMESLQSEILPELSRRFRPEIYAIGESLTPTSVVKLSADARQSDLTGALAAIRERFRGRRIAGIVVLSDGGDTGQRTVAADLAPGPAVFTVGVGAATGLRDREVSGVVAGDPQLDEASVDLQVSAVSYGYGREPFELQLLENGQAVDSRTVVPAADGSPVNEVFTVSPNLLNGSVYTLEIGQAAGEASSENNRRTVFVRPSGRKRRVLSIQGAPGFDHSFLTRALSRDPSLELDIVVRKGRNESGQYTFFVQAASDRASALTNGFPPGKDALYKYDAVIVANVEADFFTQAQLTLMAEFTGTRGGGLLVLGGQSFAQKGLIGTPLEEVLPVELSDRRSPMSRAGLSDAVVQPNMVTVTPDGERHPVMRIGQTPAEIRERWGALPALAASAPLGGPRPGASVLAITGAPSGVAPLVAVHRYGAGRSMIFGGEGSWRWRMMRPATDTAYDQFWRQALRWLAAPAPDPVAITLPDEIEPGDAAGIAVDARNASFEPVADAVVRATITGPGGKAEPLTLRQEAGVSGRFTGAWQPQESGLYRIQAQADRGQTSLGSADRWVYVGGNDREFADPRLNEGVLRRIARDSGGQYMPLSDISRVVSSLESAAPALGEPERRDLWHNPWIYVLLIGFLSAEWILRRRWGLR
jgi:uncharacterized membrane protein